MDGELDARAGGDDLLPALGLSSQQARVLRALGDQADSTPASLAALSGLTRPQVSLALQRLEQNGLVEVHRTGRPHLVSLVTDVEPVLEQLLRQAAAGRAEQASRADQAADELRRWAAAVERSPRACAPRRRPPGVGPGADHDLLVAQQSYDEVARLDGATVRYGVPLRRRGTARRLLVLGAPTQAAIRQWQADGAEVRCTDQELPVLVVVDRVRARVEVPTSAVGRTGWTFDRLQTSALLQLFELWWSGAEPGR